MKSTTLEKPPVQRQYQPTNGLVIAMISMSCGGKSFIAKNLVADGHVNPHHTHTDRPKRPDETDLAYDHMFVSPERFTELERAGRFIVRTALYGHNYGLTPVPESVDQDRPTLLLAKPQVVPALRTVLPDMMVYAIGSADGLDLLEENMRKRGQSAADIQARKALAADEQEACRELADRVFQSPGHPRFIIDAVTRAAMTDHMDYTERLAA